MAFFGSSGLFSSLFASKREDKSVTVEVKVQPVGHEKFDDYARDLKNTDLEAELKNLETSLQKKKVRP